MKCIIAGVNIKILARAVQMLSKIGDEMFVMPQKDCLSLRSVNGSNSAYVDVTFFDNYFTYYEYENLNEADSLRCKVLIRSALAVFKVPSLLEKQVESCQLALQSNDENLSIILKYKNGITKTHLLPIIDCETVKANYKKDGTANHLCIRPKVLNDAVQNFQQNLVEITIEVQRERVLIRNYIDEASSICNETRTQLAFGVGEFDEYTIDTDSTITFCLKELRAILHFSEAVQEPIDIHFDRAGRPVVFICKSTTLETNVVLATLNPDIDAASQSTVSLRPNVLPKKTVRRAPAKSKSGVKSLSKRSFDETRRSNRNETDSATNSEAMTESLGRISDVSETSLQARKRNSSDSSRTCTPKSMLNSDTTCGARKNPFSSLLKRKSEISSPGRTENDDVVQNSPPRHASKKAKLIFQKCFQTTLDERQLRYDNDDIEVKDSDEDD